MSDTKIEIEIRAKAPSNITEILLRKGAKKIAEFLERDRYYMLREGFIFRIRNNKIFTIKCNVDNRDNGWYEWESEVKNTKKLEDILLKSGFKLFGVVNKKRQKYQYKDFKINLDDVEGLGKFIEVELFDYDKNRGLRRIKKFLTELGIKKMINKGYINIIRKKNYAKR